MPLSAIRVHAVVLPAKEIDAAYPGQHRDQAAILDEVIPHTFRGGNPEPGSTPGRQAASTLPFTPKHGSWLNLIEGFFSKFARSVLRHIRVTSKHELKQRIMAGIDDVNRHPVIHTWSYKLAEAA